MARVTATEVKEIVDTDVSDSTVDPFITSANVFVTDRLGSAGLGSDLLKEIERWVAAHMLIMQIEKGGLDRQAAGDESEAYKGNAGDGLKWTRYGQQAIALDPTGKLNKAGKPKARFVTIDHTLDD